MKKLSLLLLLALFPAAVFAGDLSLSAGVDKDRVALDETLTLEVAVIGSGNVPEPRLPAMPEFAVVSRGQSQSYSFDNGRMSSAVSFRYVLAPKNKGRFTIAPVTLTQDGKTYRTQPLTVEVTDQATAAPRPAAGAAVGAARDDSRDYFVTASLDKATAYVNEPVVYTFKFYRSGQVLSQPQYQAPDFSGFWTEDAVQREYREARNGRQYLVTELKSVIAPTKPGSFAPGSATLQCTVEDASADSFGDGFFQGMFAAGKPRTMRSGPLHLTVLPLPGNGRPKDFNGAVGRYTVTASFDKTSLRANEAATLTVTVAGSGALKTLPAPVLPAWPEIRTYETASTVELRKETGNLEGSKTFKTVLVPLSSGPKNLGPVTYSFFDPAARAYRTVSTGPLKLDVRPATPGSVPAAGPSPAVAAAPVTRGQQDIRYIKTLNRWRPASRPLYRTTWFILLNSLPFAAVAAALLFDRRRRRLEQDPAYARGRRASRTARAWLKQAGGLMNGGTTGPESVRAYYAAIARALREYIARKVNGSADGMTFAGLAAALEQRAVPAALIARIKTVLDECDQVQFAPVDASRGMMDSVFTEAGNIITELEKLLK